jgi:cell division GTPase FtsZ
MTRQLHFIGLGGGGCNAVEYVHSKGIQATYTCISYPERPSLPSDIHFSTFARHNKWDLFDGYDLVRKNRRYVLLAGLGGKTGTYLVEEFILLLQYQNRNFLTICSLPFAFEGYQRRTIANGVRTKFQSMNNFICFDLNSIVKHWGDMTLTDAFEKADERFFWLSQGLNFN